jgi:hypothetical protein
MKAKAPDKTVTPAIPTVVVPTVYTREKLMQVTGVLIEETFQRVSGDRFRLRDGDRERLAYIRALKELIQLHAELLEKSGTPKTINGTPKITTDEDREYEAWQKEELHSMSKMLMSCR